MKRESTLICEEFDLGNMFGLAYGNQTDTDKPGERRFACSLMINATDSAETVADRFRSFADKIDEMAGKYAAHS